MKLTLICVGRMSPAYAGVQEHYLRLLRPYGSTDVIEVRETPLHHGRDRVVTAESDALLKRMRPDAFTVVLDRSGKQLDSKELSRLLAERKLYGRSDFQFILGGALGLDGRVIEAADYTWSLSKLTFPHQLARCVVLEQLYRATRIERGEPYHY